MTKREVLSELKTLGTAQNRKIYKRHGVTGESFGVSYANLEKIRKRIKVDHELAEDLWATGNHDARVLATMIADPEQTEEQKLEAWAKDLENYVIADAFVGLAGKTAYAQTKMTAWTKSKNEWIGSAGWGLVATLAMKEEELPDIYFEAYLSVIEKKIHKEKNRVRYAMNNALIAIGVRSDALEKKAIAAAKRIGKIEVDHGETGCKTPDAVAYINKTLERRKKKAAAKK